MSTTDRDTVNERRSLSSSLPPASIDADAWTRKLPPLESKEKLKNVLKGLHYLDMDGLIMEQSINPKQSGGYSDVFVGKADAKLFASRFCENGSLVKVAVKRLRIRIMYESADVLKV